MTKSERREQKSDKKRRKAYLASNRKSIFLIQQALDRRSGRGGK